MNIFIDKFKLEFKKYGGVSHKNYPYTPIGEPKTIATDHNSNVKFILMNTGIIYYRPTTCAELSPYGWNDLHKSLILIMSKGYKEFEHDIKYELGIHLSNLRSILVDGNKTELKDHVNLSRYLESFNQRQEIVYHKHNLIDYLRHVYTILEDYGVTPE